MTPRPLSEHAKNFFEYLRHLTTLSTGAILLLTAFLEKIFPHPKWKAVVVGSLASFCVAVVASVLTYTVMIYRAPGGPSDKLDAVAGCSLYTTWIGFLTGILLLTIFAIKNILSLQ